MAIDASSSGSSELTQEEQATLARFYEYQRTRSAELRDALVLEHTALVEKLARQFISSGEPVEDLMQEGYIGLIKAVDRFEPDKGVKFTTYATHIITGEIRHYLRDLGKLIQEPGWHQQLRYQITRSGDLLQQKLGRQPTVEEIALDLGIEAEKVERVLKNSQVFQVESLDAGIEEDEEGNTGTRYERVTDVEPFNGVEQVETRMVLRQAMAKLGKLQRTVVFYFFYQDMTKTEIARQLGISVNYASYLVKRALRNLRRYLEESGAYSAEVEKRLVEFEERVEQMETLDVGTSLPTAATFHRHLHEEIMRARRYPQEFSLVLFQLNGWGGIRPSLTSREVDNVLRQFTHVLRNNCRTVDKLYRYDDMRLVALLPHTGIHGKTFGERVKRIVQQNPLQRVPGQAVPHLSVSYRIAVFPTDGSTAEELLDSLMPEDKKNRKKGKSGEGKN
ncbi:MAG: sigma-70 family RNA polymerase sigma factor [Abditibacteriales bacterium]|nr:sigma-70 family RNA polymerase sigma factor [Abditibacteriales bacterium]MDW8365009.1 sigma-70 family RNA polymerase sigma factor [Abditibacteriales bacterium]